MLTATMHYVAINYFLINDLHLKSKITPTYGVKKIGPGLRQTQICGGVKAVNEINIIIF